MTRRAPDHLRTSTRIKVAAAVYLVTLAMALVGVRLALPILEEWFLPVIDPKTDRVLNVRLFGSDLCWDSDFYKRRPGVPVRVSWTMTLTSRAGGMPSLIIGVAPRRVEGELAPSAPYINLSPDEPHHVGWCVRLPTTDFGSVRITADWEYRTHRWWTVHQSRTPIVFHQ